MFKSIINEINSKNNESVSGDKIINSTIIFKILCKILQVNIDLYFNYGLRSTTLEKFYNNSFKEKITIYGDYDHYYSMIDTKFNDVKDLPEKAQKFRENMFKGTEWENVSGFKDTLDLSDL